MGSPRATTAATAVTISCAGVQRDDGASGASGARESFGSARPVSLDCFEQRVKRTGHRNVLKTPRFAKDEIEEFVHWGNHLPVCYHAEHKVFPTG